MKSEGLPPQYEIRADLPDGAELTLYEAIGPAMCGRCGLRADDVCFRLEYPTGVRFDDGLCAVCLVDVLRGDGATLTRTASPPTERG